MLKGPGRMLGSTLEDPWHKHSKQMALHRKIPKKCKIRIMRINDRHLTNFTKATTKLNQQQRMDSTMKLPHGKVLAIAEQLNTKEQNNGLKTADPRP